MQSSKGNCMTEEVTEMPRCCSRRIQSEVAWRVALRPFTVPAIWMAPPNRSNFSVSVVLPASGCEMMANVLRRLISFDISDSVTDQFLERMRAGYPRCRAARVVARRHCGSAFCLGTIYCAFQSLERQ